jgi:hypothetical protein
MTIDWQRVLPVIASILIIISVAIVRQYSKALAPILATMPINIPLAMWIVYSGDPNDQAGMSQFIRDMSINMMPTLVFLVLAWLASRAGWELAPTIVLGYIGWGISLGALLLARRLLGI